MKDKWTVNYSTKRHILFYEFERLWLFLSLLNIIALFFIVRGSTAPLISNNALLHFFFYSNENGDKTLYNIAISYFAAYIFYIIQVYYPEWKRTKRTLINIALPSLNLINQTTMFLFVWNTFTKKNLPDDGTILDTDIREIYYKDTEGDVYFADKDELIKIAGRIREAYEQITTDSTFQFCDNSLRQLLMEKNISNEVEGLYQTLLSAEALSSSKSSTILETYSNEDVEEIVLRLRKLNDLLKLGGKFDYTLTTDVSDIEKRKDVDRMAFEIILENLEYFSKLHKESKEPEKENSK